MKVIYLRLVAVSLGILAAGCASSPGSHQAYLAPSATPSPAAQLLVISATYGSGTKAADVTDRVNDLLHQPSGEFFAQPAWLHADPTPGWNKELTVVYEYKGRRCVFATGEGGKVNVDLLAHQAKK